MFRKLHDFVQPEFHNRLDPGLCRFGKYAADLGIQYQPIQCQPCHFQIRARMGPKIAPRWSLESLGLVPQGNLACCQENLRDVDNVGLREPRAGLAKGLDEVSEKGGAEEKRLC